MMGALGGFLGRPHRAVRPTSAPSAGNLASAAINPPWRFLCNETCAVMVAGESVPATWYAARCCRAA